MRSIFFVLIFFFFFTASAQKRSYDIVDAKDIQKIVFSGDEVYKINVETVSDKEIRIFSKTEGEYYNQISIDTDIRDGTLYLSSRYNENLQGGYDKLSAHKVYSMEVKLEIPEGMIFSVNSNIASVLLSGSYESVLIQLKTGSCYFDNFEGNAVVNTYDGNIFGDAKSFNLEASSRNGEVNIPENSSGIHKMVLTSINGNIKLSENK